MLQSKEAPHTSNGKLRPKRVFDQAAVEAAIFDLLVAIGEDPHRDGLRDTPWHGPTARHSQACTAIPTTC
jgi:GTP cyclohydrolase IA